MTRSAAVKKQDYESQQQLDKEIEEFVFSIVRHDTPAEHAIGRLIKNPKIAVGKATIDFTSDKWDFTPVTDRSINPGSLKIIFHEHRFDGLIRLWILFLLATDYTKVQSILNRAKIVDKFAKYVDSLDVTTLSLLNIEVVESFTRWRKKSICERTLWTEAQSVINFLKFYESAVSPIANQEVYKHLTNLKVSTSHKDKSYPPVPEEYFASLNKVCLRTMRDETEDYSQRVIACALLIASQTGMRTCELIGLRVDAMRISKAPIEGEPDIPYIIFMSPKMAYGDNEWIEAHCVLNEMAYEAFNTAVVLSEDFRSEKEIDSLIVFKRQKLEFLSQSALRIKMKEFLVEHRNEIPCINSMDRFPELSYAPIRSVYLSHAKNRTIEEYIEFNYPDLSESDVLVYPKLRQFRSNVVTELRSRGMDWKYIQTQVTHLDEDSANSYCYDNEETEHKHSENVYRMVFLGKATMLGKHAKEFMATVESYIKETGLNVAENLDEVIETAAGKFPLREKMGGICIRCGNFTNCEDDEPTDKLLCAFGVCLNHCHFFFNAPYSYSLAKERVRIIEHNDARGWTKAVANEKRKLKNIVEDSLLPELLELEKEINTRGIDDILECHPKLEEIARNIEKVIKEVKSWAEM